MSKKHFQVASLLMDVEYSLRNMGAWSEERPSDEALASEAPFCLDTLTFEQWLQFIFLERMRILLDNNLPLPEKCGVAPMAEVHFAQAQRNPGELIAHLDALDQVLSEG